MHLRLAILLCVVGLIATVIVVRVPGTDDPEAIADMASDSLSGTWQLTELRGATLDAGPLLILAEDGRVHGDTGCNGFAGDYEAGEGRIEFGPLAMTRRACIDPQANAREASYTAALEAAGRYTTGDGRLTLRDGAGAAVADFVAVPESEPVGFACDDGSDIVAVFLASDPPFARLTRGEGGAMARQAATASGARYEGDSVVFWTKGAEARVDWRGEELTCRKR